MHDYLFASLPTPPTTCFYIINDVVDVAGCFVPPVMLYYVQLQTWGPSLPSILGYITFTLSATLGAMHETAPL